MANYPAVTETAQDGGGARLYKGQFGSLKFPKFQHQEYPKQIKDAGGKLLGRALNAMEEREILEKAGLEANAPDPVAAMQSEMEALRAKLAQYEGNDPARQIAGRATGAKTGTVQMLPDAAPLAPSTDKDAVPTEPVVAPSDLQLALKPSTSGQGNPLLRGANAMGAAPQVTKTITPGV